jgi:tRNA pseudouridine55 synthase
VDGVLLLDKPTGMSSNSALQAARRLFSAAKAGHTGTLDPLASGLLPLCFGEATKFSVDLLAADKTYEAELLFGVRTDTGDADGTVVMRCPVDFGESELEAALPVSVGPIRQVPPMYSALKRDGRPLYELARQGIEVEREAREVVIHELRLLDFSGDRCRLRMACSKGTYIRSLAEDLGRCARLRSAPDRAAPGRRRPAADQRCGDARSAGGNAEDDRAAWLLAPDTLLQSLPAVYLEEAGGATFSHGNPVTLTHCPGKCRVYADESPARPRRGR